MERSIVILIDGFTNGIFGPEARKKSGESISEWIEELSGRPDFVELQMSQWTDAIKSKVSNTDYGNDYHYFKEYSPQWSTLNQLLQYAHVHKKMESMFTTILGSPVTAEKSIAIAVDTILDKLISEFDMEELPLRKKERMEELVIENEGDRDYAEKLFSNERNLEEKVSFTQLLTNFVMHPEVSNSSIATQKLGLALSKEWINAAHDDFTAEYRSKKPTVIDIQFGDWVGTTNDGSNEEELLDSLQKHTKALEQRDIENARKSNSFMKKYIGMAAGIGLAILVWPWMILITGFFAWSYYKEKKDLENKIASLIAHYDAYYEKHREILRATVAEYVDWQRTFASVTENASKIAELLEPVTVEQYSFTNYDTARSILAR